jgi:hypothetical protein
LVSDSKVGAYTEGAGEKDAEGNIWTEVGWSDERVEKTA